MWPEGLDRMETWPEGLDHGGMWPEGLDRMETWPEGLDHVVDEDDVVNVQERVTAKKVLAALRATIARQVLFDNVGKAVVNELTELVRIFRAVHMHEGGDSLFFVVREIVSAGSPVFAETRSSLREQSRRFVEQCEACQMCRRNSKQPVEMVARAAIRVSVQGGADSTNSGAG